MLNLSSWCFLGDNYMLYHLNDAMVIIYEEIHGR